MVLADFGFAWFGIILLVGFLGFFVVLLAAALRVVGAIWRAIIGSGRRAGPARHTTQASPHVCENPRCGYLNSGNARYCARCGHTLGHTAGLSSYG